MQSETHPLAGLALSQVGLPLRQNYNEWLGFVPFYEQTRTGLLQVVELGNHHFVRVDPRKLFWKILATQADSIVLIHNHPSGARTPSQEDWILTTNVCRVAHLLGIEVIGHWIVFAEGQYWMHVDNSSPTR